MLVIDTYYMHKPYIYVIMLIYKAGSCSLPKISDFRKSGKKLWPPTVPSQNGLLESYFALIKDAKLPHVYLMLCTLLFAVCPFIFRMRKNDQTLKMSNGKHARFYAEKERRDMESRKR